MLISKVPPIMSIYCLPHSQFGYSGHILNVPQDVNSFANELPSCQLLLMLSLFEEKEQMKLKNFQVRRAVVLRALQRLIVNNMYYNDVVINNDA